MTATMETAVRTHQLWINGEAVDAASGETFDVFEPATGEKLATVAKAGAADADAAITAAQGALVGAWKKTSPTQRSRMLHAYADLIVENRNELCELETRNVGKAISSVKAELFSAAEVFRYFASALSGHTGTATPIGGSLMSYTLKDPVGVCAQIIPWNYPFMMAAWKLAPAIASGSVTVLKPASNTPLSAIRLGQLATEAGIPDGVVNVLPGPGSTLGAYLVTHPGVQKVAFTGETATGVEIMQAAAPGMKRTTLELGGKSPNIVFADADLDQAIPSSVWSIFYSGGQSCEARSRILVERSIYDEFVARFTEATKKLVVGDPLDPATQVGSLINTGQVETAEKYTKLGVSEGARLTAGGERPGGDLAAGAFWMPTVLADVDNSWQVAQDEIFGPVVTIIPFDDEKEAVRLANDVRYGLMATVWTGSDARGHRVARAVQSGLIGINMPYTAFPGVPFGGYKESGFGRELTLESLNAYTETKGVLFNTGARPYNPFGL